MAIENPGGHGGDLNLLFTLGVPANLTDRPLLERFSTGEQESSELAFKALFDRYKTMVLRVCQAQLHDPNDVMDAFQATFLILIRRTKSIWIRDSLGPWIHQVAYRTALAIRRTAARRRKHEDRVAELVRRRSMTSNRQEFEAEEWLHEEIARLPRRHRESIVLCDFQGLSTEEAARALGCSVGTLKCWRSRARQRLRDELIRRGMAPSLQIGMILRPGGSNLGATSIHSPSLASKLLAGDVQSSILTLAKGVSGSMISKFSNPIAFAFLFLFIGIQTAFLVPLAPGIADEPPRQEAMPIPSDRIYSLCWDQTPRAGDGFRGHGLLRLDPSTQKASFNRVPSLNFFRVSPNGEEISYVGAGGAISIASLVGENAPIRIGELPEASLRNSPGHTQQTLWSGDGKQIIVTSDALIGGNRWSFESYLVNVDGTGFRKLPLPATESVEDWSADGQLLATLSFRKGQGVNDHELWVMKPDGTQEFRVLSSGVHQPIRFSPDSSSIACRRQLGDKFGIWISPTHQLDQGQFIAIEQAKGEFWTFCWSPDGKWIACPRNDEAGPGGKPTSVPSATKIALINTKSLDRLTIDLQGYSIFNQIDWR